MLMCYIRISIRLGFCAYRTRASLVAQLVKNPPAMQEIWFRFLGWEDPWRRRRLPTPEFWPGELRGLYSPRGQKESDTTEPLSLSGCCVHPQLIPFYCSLYGRAIVSQPQKDIWSFFFLLSFACHLGFVAFYEIFINFLFFFVSLL